MRDITDERNNIYELQRYLRRLHYDNSEMPLVNPDGIYGDETREAVAEFQRRMGLPVTGNTDNDTWNAIYREYSAASDRLAPPRPISPFPNEENYVIRNGERSDIAEIVQFMLRLLADTYDAIEGKSAEGVFNEATAADVRVIQQTHGLPITGEVDKATWNALAEAYNRANRVYN